MLYAGIGFRNTWRYCHRATLCIPIPPRSGVGKGSTLVLQIKEVDGASKYHRIKIGFDPYIFKLVQAISVLEVEEKPHKQSSREERPE